MSRSRAARPVVLVDSTLRDGAQAPRVVLTDEMRIRIAGLLSAAGVAEIEAGIPAMGDDEIGLLSRLTRQFGNRRIIAWCRACTSDLDAAKRSGCRAVHIAFPLSFLQLEATGLDESRLFDRLSEMLRYAASRFDFVSAGAMDASRADINLLRRFCRTAFLLGAGRVRIADTVGILTPLKTARLMADLGPVIDLGKIEFHAHNDFGMATANAVSAIESGAGAVSVTVNGLGERAGNAALEEVAVALRCIEGISSTIDLPRLQSMCEVVAALTGRAIPVWKPITGSDIFLHESGIHWRAMLGNPDAFEPYPPAATGHVPSEPIAGSHCGGSTICALLARRGVATSSSDARRIASAVRHHIRQRGRLLTEKEIGRIITEKDRL